MAEPGKNKKVCFVTIGATAAFDALIQTALNGPFLSALQDLGYTGLVLQYGRDEEQSLRRHIDSLQHPDDLIQRIEITGFGFRKNGLRSEIAAAREGVVISHAGSGTILEALRLSVPLIVVPNPTLLNNHQEELAEEMEYQGYAVHGKLDDLVAALSQAETLRKQMNEWPPKSSHGDGRGLVGIIDDELGFVD